jgi:hypothetical protein
MSGNSAPSWQALQAAGLVDGSQPEPSVESPWFVRLMLGVAGWMAAAFLLGFVAQGLGWLLDNDVATLAGGLSMMAAAWLLLRRLAHNDFAAQFALAVSFAGQALFSLGLVGLLGHDRPATTFWLLTALLQVVLAAVMPSSIHRLWSAFAAGVAIYLSLQGTVFAFATTAMILAAAAWVWTCEFRWPQRCSIVRPLAYGLVLALVTLDMGSGLTGLLLGYSGDVSGNGDALRWAGQLLSGAVLVWIVWRLLRRAGLGPGDRAAVVVLGGTAAVVLLSLEAPGIATGVSIILLGFAHGNRLLTAIGIAALLLYIGGYYYRLEITLLAKSQALAISGASILALRWLALRWLGLSRTPVG